MAHFVRLTNSSGLKVRVNMDRVFLYQPDREVEGGTRLVFEGQDFVFVRETAEEIDRLLNPTGTP